MPPEDNGVHFENQGDEFGAPTARSGGFDLVGALVRAGLASNVQQAQYALVGVAVLALLVAGFFFFRSAVSSGPPPPPPPDMAPDAGAQQ